MGGGLWGGGGLWTSRVPDSLLKISVPFGPALSSNVSLITKIATIVKNSSNTNFTQLAAQPNILGNEIDVFIVNPAKTTGTLVRSLYRYPLNKTDGYILTSSTAISYYQDFGLVDEAMYYYTWFPDNGDASLSVSSQSTSSYGYMELIWDTLIPDIYKERDSEYVPTAVLTTTVAPGYNGTRTFAVTDVSNIALNQIIQVRDQIVNVRQVNFVNNTVVVSPPLPQTPSIGDIVIINGLGFPFKRFIKVFAEQLDYMHSRIKALKNNRQIDLCDDRYLPLFAKFVGLGDVINVGGVADTRSARNQIKKAVSLYQINGTKAAIQQLVQSIVGPSYSVQIDDMKDMIMFTNNFNSFNGVLRNDNTVDTNNNQTYLQFGKFGDPSRYTPDATNNAVYAPYVIRISIQIFSHFELIQGYTNTIFAIISKFLPIGVNFYLLWDTTQPTLNFTGTGFGVTFTSTVSHTP